MSQITVSLETAKKMKEAGRTKECFFVHIVKSPNNNFYSGRSLPLKAPGITFEGCVEDEKYEAYYLQTAQEILDELPDIIDDCILTLNKVNVEKEGEKMYYGAGYLNRKLKGIHNGKSVAHVGVNASEALAKLRLRCKENGFI